MSPPPDETPDADADAGHRRPHVLVVFGVAAVVILPALALLYVLDQRSLLPEEGAEA